MDIPHFQLDAVPRSDLHLATHPVLSAVAHDPIIWVHIPECFASGFLLYEVNETQPNNGEVPGLGGASQDVGKPWVRFAADALNWNNGYHIYQLKFLDQVTEGVTSLYFAYYVHSDTQPKDYIYMDRERVNR